MAVGISPCYTAGEGALRSLGNLDMPGGGMGIAAVGSGRARLVGWLPILLLGGGRIVVTWQRRS